MKKIIITIGKGSQVDVVTDVEDANNIVQAIEEMEPGDTFFTNLVMIKKSDIVSVVVEDLV